MADKDNQNPALVGAAVNPNALNQPNPAAANRAAEDARRMRAENRRTAEKNLDEQDQARADQIADREAREAGMKPTPTQRENDLAKMGLLDLDEKEDDGSGPEPVMQRVAVPQQGGDRANYKTRDVGKK